MVDGDKKKKNRGGSKRKLTPEECLAYKSVAEWVYLDQHNSSPPPSAAAETVRGGGVVDDFGVQKTVGRVGEKLVFDLHSHSKFSDGFLSPSKLVERGHANGEPVHILAYYSSCGPMKYEELDKCLSYIREGRFLRAKDMVLKLNKLKVPLKWGHVARIAGEGVAPGRLHVARALLEAGYVENLKQVFTNYLYDGGPPYSTGREPPMEDAVRLIRETGGIAVLAQLWGLKNPESTLIYKSDGRLEGSDYHAKGGHRESDLGSVNLSATVLYDFLMVARPIWCNAIRHNLQSYAEGPTDSNLAIITRFGGNRISKGIDPLNSCTDLLERCLALWLMYEERQRDEFVSIRAKLVETWIDLSSVIDKQL